MEEVVKEFVVECHEYFNQLDQDLVALEKEPESPDLIGRIFRAIHTIKGVAGFLTFSHLEAVSHSGESLLAALRDGKLTVDAEIISSLLATVDAMRRMLASIESAGDDGNDSYLELNERLDALVAGAPSADSSHEESEPQAEVATGVETSVTEIQDRDGPPITEASPPGRYRSEQANEVASQTSSVREEEKPVESAPASSADGGANAAAVEANIRVSVSLLDRLMNLVGELVLARNQILQFSVRANDAGFLSTVQRLNLITTELQEGIMKTRMQPIGNVWNKFPRLVRDLALMCGKQVRIEMEGEETELDKTLIEAIRDPLTHIVRNAIDHGIETPADRVAAGKPAQGCLWLRAFHESGQVNIEISDDGGGIRLDRVRAKALEGGLITHDQAAQMRDSEVLNLIFAPGFSTATKVTNVSGRGVGMDVVKINIEKIGGTVDAQSEPGRGTTLKIRIPLTLAIIPAVVVTCERECYAIPQVSLIELVRLEGEEVRRRIETIHGAPVYRLRGHLLPLVYLRQVLNSDSHSGPEPREAAHIVVLQVGERQFGLVVDEVNDTEEIVVKPLGKQLKAIPAFAGATIMGDGKVALILDALGIAQLSGVLSESHEESHGDDRQESRAGSSRQRLLLFRAAGFERLAMPLSLVARLEEFQLSQIEHAAGCRVVQYRGKILPLIRLEGLMAGRGETTTNSDQSVQVVVIGDGEHTIGIEVDQIVDIIEEQVNAPQMSQGPGLLGSAILGNKVTDFVDVDAVLRQADQNWFGNDATGAGRFARILLVEPHSFARKLIRSYLEMAGHSVLEAGEWTEAVETFTTREIDLAMVALDLPDGGAIKLLGEIRKHPVNCNARVIGLGEQTWDSNREVRFDDCQPKLDRAALLGSIVKLLDGGGDAGSGHDVSSRISMEA